MDYLEKGKQLAQQGNYEEALDALYLALENDKENADIHFYLGLCYSSKEQFKYARYHYEIALAIDPNHQKTKLVWDGIKEFSPEKPPERRQTRSATAKERKKQQESLKEIESAQEHEKIGEEDVSTQEADTGRNIGQYPVSESKWEQAFPSDSLEKKQGESFLLKLFIFLITVGIIVAIAIFTLHVLEIWSPFDQFPE